MPRAKRSLKALARRSRSSLSRSRKFLRQAILLPFKLPLALQEFLDRFEERFSGFRVRRVVKVVAVLRDEEVLAHAVDAELFPRGLPNLDVMACDFVFLYGV